MKNLVLHFVISIILIANTFSKTQEKWSVKTPIKFAISNQKHPQKEVPVLCYHRIREIQPTDGPNLKTYSVTPSGFASQMKTLHDQGYQTILPDQLYNNLVNNKPLPPKPIMITFDDTREEQYQIAAAELKKHNFKGVFFIMTVSINKSGYMTASQIKNLSDNGHVIANHTWDHHMVTKYSAEDWITQLLKPQKKLEAIIGKPVHYFSYPFGLWNATAIDVLQKNGYKLAFILSDRKASPNYNYTIRRMIVSGGWSASRMMENMKATFN